MTGPDLASQSAPRLGSEHRIPRSWASHHTPKPKPQVCCQPREVRGLPWQLGAVSVLSQDFSPRAREKPLSCSLHDGLRTDAWIGNKYAEGCQRHCDFLLALSLPSAGI